ncbi:MAG: hypothetical protein DYG94_14265 [Leptolyngbya sp. PLA3]|nr:MAG: hypothetical protein EDM82_13275 [Cyanobacteria bacterium CYA]MCE7969892.1 hypothetical protein [Leptolyngbya sp. PL-A3]
MNPLTLAWRPFLDPLNLDHAWYLLLVPMSFFLAMGYKAVRTVDMNRYWSQVAIFTFQMVIGLIGLGAGFFVVVRILLPALAPMDR